MEWSREKALRLVDLYRARPVLWNSQTPFYKDRSKRYEALLEIAASLGETKGEVDRKIKNLCCHYSRELKKESESTGPGGNAYKSKWFAYDKMEFLRDKRKSVEPKHLKLETPDVEDADDVKINGTLDFEIGTDDELTTIYAGETSKKFRPSKSKTTNHLVNEVVKKVSTRKGERDELTLFGEIIAIRLRKLQTEHARVMVQQIINTTLFEAELGKYNDPQRSQIYSTFSSAAPSFMPLLSETLTHPFPYQAPGGSSHSPKTLTCNTATSPGSDFSPQSSPKSCVTARTLTPLKLDELDEDDSIDSLNL